MKHTFIPIPVDHIESLTKSLTVNDQLIFSFNLNNRQGIGGL